MILFILTFTLGLGGGTFRVEGDDIVSPSFGPSFNLRCGVEVVPSLEYEFILDAGKCKASTRTMVYDSLGDPYSWVVGEDFEFLHGKFHVNWYPLELQFNPYLKASIGLMHWRFVSNGEVVKSLNGNSFERNSLTLGGGFGISKEIAGFIAGVDFTSDFIFSVDNDWIEGFGTADDNEYKYGLSLYLLRRF